jgi:hypothetical protein
MDINEWFADQCGVKITEAGEDGCFYRKASWSKAGAVIEDEWTLYDARCVQVVREKFGICTVYRSDKKTYACHMSNQHEQGFGKTISEAEISCLHNIYNNRSGES